MFIFASSIIFFFFSLSKGGMIKTWKKRLFILDSNGVLSYFKSNPDGRTKGIATPSGTINTASCRMLKIDSEPASVLWPSGCPSARCGIVIRTPARTYAMYAESQASALRWAQLLAMAAKLCPACGMSCFDARMETPGHVPLASKKSTAPPAFSLLEKPVMMG